MLGDEPTVSAVLGALAGATGTFLLRRHQDGNLAKQQDERAFRAKVQGLETRLVRLEAEMDFFRTGLRAARGRGALV